MTALIDWANGISATWADAMIRASWQGAVGLLLAWGICALLARRAGRVQSWFWRLGYAKFLFCLVWLVPVNLALIPAKPLPPADVQPEFVADPVDDAPTAQLPAALETPRPSTVTWLMGLWCIGVLATTARLIVIGRRTRNLRRNAARVNDEAIFAMAQQTGRDMGLRRAPEILAAENITGPLLLGMLRPAIILPARLIAPPPAPHNFSEDLARFKDLRLIFAHEIAHIQRRDLAWNWLQTATSVLFFFHPLVWLTRAPWRLAQELACDERVLRATKTDAGSYAKLLVNLLEHTSINRRRLMGVGVAESGVTLKRRLLAMKDFSPSKTNRITAAALAATFIGIGGLVPWRVVAQTPATAPEKTSAAPESAPAENGIPVYTGADPSAIVINDTIITQVVPVKNIDAVRLANELRPLFSADTTVTANAANNSLIIQDTSAKIHRYVEVIAGLDHPPAVGRGATGPATSTVIQPGQFEAVAEGRGPSGGFGGQPGPGGRGQPSVIDGKIQVSAILAAQTADLAAPLDGTLLRVLAKPGQTVKAGTQLFQFDDATVRADYEAAKARERLAESKYAVTKQQTEVGNSGPSAARDAQSAIDIETANLHRVEAELAKYTIKAPFDGTLSGSDLSPGVYLEKGKLLARLVNTSEIRVSFDVPAGYTNGLAIGQKFTFAPTSLPDVQCDAEITYIAPTAEAAPFGGGGGGGRGGAGNMQEQVTFRGKITTNLDKIKPGMRGTVMIPAGK